MPIKFNGLMIKNVTIPLAAYTAGTTFTVAHGLGYKPNLNAIDIIPLSTTATGTDDVQAFALVSADSTNVTLKPSRTLTSTGNMQIWLDKDIGGRQVASA